jgi:hypothetical protein
MAPSINIYNREIQLINDTGWHHDHKNVPAASARSLLPFNLGCSMQIRPARRGFSAADYQAFPILGLAASLREERDYEACVEDGFPILQGTLIVTDPPIEQRPAQTMSVTGRHGAGVPHR